jgi:glycosyltransferase involved in cell wall biosynthesis
MISYTSLLQKLSRKKCEELAKYEDMELFLLVPPFSRELWSREKLPLEKNPKKSYNIRIGRAFPLRNLHFSLFYRGLLGTLRQLKPDIIDLENEPFNLGTFQVILARNLVSPESKIVFQTWQNIFKRYPFPFNLVEKFTYQNADRALARNEEAGKILRKKGFSGPISILPPGVDSEQFKKGKRKKVALAEKNEFVIGYIGAIVKQKGVLTLIEAVSKLKAKFRLLFIGRGDYEEAVREKVRQLKLREKTLFLGTVPHREIPGYLGSLDVLVLPSLTFPNWKEQFGRVLIEAMSSEIPVIGSNSGEIPRVIQEGGLIFKEGNSEDLREKLELLLSNKSLCGKLARKGRKRVLEQYSWKVVARKTYQIYKEILKNSEMEVIPKGLS